MSTRDGGGAPPGSQYSVPPPSPSPAGERELTLADATHARDGSVWNFAFGANLSRRVLTGRRRIEPLESLPAVVFGWELSFDYRGLPFLEPGFGTLRKVTALSGPGSEDGGPRREGGVCVHGVVHRMSAPDYQQLLVTEGGSGRDDVPGYRAVPVRCRVYQPSADAVHPPTPCPAPTTAPGAEIVAVALVATADVIRPGTLPSDRYAKLLVTGAHAYGLDKEYQRFLQAQPRHTKTCAGICSITFLYTVLLLPLWLLLWPFWCCCGGTRRKEAKEKDPVTGQVVVLQEGRPPARCFHGIGRCVSGVVWTLNCVCLPWCRGGIEYPEEGVRSPQDLAARWPQFKEAAWERQAQQRDTGAGAAYPLPVAAFRL
jgi:hypothetical protein